MILPTRSSSCPQRSRFGAPSIADRTPSESRSAFFGIAHATPPANRPPLGLARRLPRRFLASRYSRRYVTNLPPTPSGTLETRFFALSSFLSRGNIATTPAVQFLL